MKLTKEHLKKIIKEEFDSITEMPEEGSTAQGLVKHYHDDLLEKYRAMRAMSDQLDSAMQKAEFSEEDKAAMEEHRLQIRKSLGVMINLFRNYGAQ